MAQRIMFFMVRCAILTAMSGQKERKKSVNFLQSL